MTNNDSIIRRETPETVWQLEHILTEMFRHTSLPGHLDRNWVVRLQGALRFGVCLTAWKDAALVGFLLGSLYQEPLTGEVRALIANGFVMPNARKRNNLGKELVHQFEQWAKENCAERIFVDCLDKKVARWFGLQCYTPISTLLTKGVK